VLGCFVFMAFRERIVRRLSRPLDLVRHGSAALRLSVTPLSGDAVPSPIPSLRDPA
jgi:hypothetical protein